MSSGDDVNIKIGATDNATAVLQKMRAEFALVGTSVKSLESKLGTAFNASVFGLGLASLTRLGSESVKMFGDSERASMMLDRVLKTTGNTIKMTRADIQRYARERMGLTIFDDDTIVDAASHLARFRDIAGETFTDTLDLAQDLSTVMGTDLVSAATALGRALTDPAEGMSRLARAGTVFTQQQENQVKLLGMLGDKAGQQRIILDEVRRQHGGAAEADAKTPHGILAQFKNELGETMEDIGKRIFPTVKAATQLLQGAMGGVPGIAGKADALLNGPRGESRGGAAEIKKLKDLKNTFNELGAEIRAEQRRWKDEGLLEFLASPVKNLSGAAMVPRNRVRREDLKEEIAIQTAIAADAARKEIPGAFLRSITNLGTQGAAGLMGAYGNLFKDQTVGGLNIGSIAEMIGKDIGINKAAFLFNDIGEKFGHMPSEQKQESIASERSLQATESRFLTRGRGQLSQYESKQIAASERIVRVMEEIARKLNEKAQNTLVVEGIN